MLFLYACSLEPRACTLSTLIEFSWLPVRTPNIKFISVLTQAGTYYCVKHFHLSLGTASKLQLLPKVRHTSVALSVIYYFTLFSWFRMHCLKYFLLHHHKSKLINRHNTDRLFTQCEFSSLTQCRLYFNDFVPHGDAGRVTWSLVENLNN